MRNKYLSVLILSACLIWVVNMVFAYWDEFHVLNTARHKAEQTLSVAPAPTESVKPAKTLNSQLVEYKNISLNKQHFVGLHYDFPLNDKDKAQQVVSSAWDSFVSHPSRLSIQDRKSDCIYFIYSDYSRYASGTISLFVGYLVGNLDKIPGQLNSITVPAQHYAEFDVQGDLVKKMPELWQKLASVNLNRRFGYDMEIYPSSNILDHTGVARLLISTTYKEK